MDKVKGVAKGGWHPPGKDGGRESWRGEFKGIGQVAGWIGKGKGSNTQVAHNHQARPLSSLKDPDSFGPPPKRTTDVSTEAVTDNDGSVSLSPGNNDRSKDASVEDAQSPLNGQKAQPPPIPKRLDGALLVTGAKPTTRHTETKLDCKSKPSLPPRLPPRQDSELSNAEQSSEPPRHDASLSGRWKEHSNIGQGALRRLGAAGIKVPDLGIGSCSEPPGQKVDEHNPRGGIAPPSPARTVSDLQSRIFQSKSPLASPEQASRGTTWEQKQAALKTASSFRDNPSSITLADARSAASTAKNFQDRHGDQVVNGLQKASDLNKKYAVAGKISGFTSNKNENPAEAVHAPSGTSSPQESVPQGRKFPPPLPPKKNPENPPRDSGPKPPPIPLASKPKT